MSAEQQYQWLRQRVEAVAEQIRRDAQHRQFANAAHLHQYAEDLERALEKEPNA